MPKAKSCPATAPIVAPTRSPRSAGFLRLPGWVRSPDFLRGLVFLILAFAAFWPSLTNGFIWDDDVMLTDNAVIAAPDGLRRIWCSTELSDYYPLTSTMFWVEWRLWGANPAGYNVLNLLLHTGGAILCWRVLRRLRVPGAWLAGLLFLVHPVAVASVDWIAERKNTLSLLFFMAALLGYLRFEDEGRWRFYGLALGAFLLALLSKTSVVVLPPVLMLFAWWKRDAIRRHDLMLTAPFFLLALALGLVTVWFQLHEVLAGDAPHSDTLLTRVLGGSRALWFYLGHTFWPAKLSLVYPAWDINPARWTAYLPGALWLAGLALCWRHRRGWGRPCFFGLAYFTLALGPVLGILDMHFFLFSQVADHLQYLALPGGVALGTALAVTLLGRLGMPASPASRALPLLGGAIPVAVLAWLTWHHASVFANEETLWRDNVRKHPTAWIAHNNLADRLVTLGRMKEASAHYYQAIQLKPDYAKSHNNYGSCLSLLGDQEKAIPAFLDAIQNKPELAEAQHNLATVYYHLKKYDVSLHFAREAIRLRPHYAAAHFTAGNAELRLNRLPEALDHYFDALRDNPALADAQYNIGLILSVQGETTAAIRFFRLALRSDPRHHLAAQELDLLIQPGAP